MLAEDVAPNRKPVLELVEAVGGTEPARLTHFLHYDPDAVDQPSARAFTVRRIARTTKAQVRDDADKYFGHSPSPRISVYNSFCRSKPMPGQSPSVM